MALMLDIEEAKTILAEQRETGAGHLNSNTILGTVARSFDLHEAATLFRIGEQNRGTDPNAVMTAVFNIFVSAIAAEIEINVLPEFRDHIIDQLAAEFVGRVVKTLAAIDKAPSISPKEFGTS